MHWGSYLCTAVISFFFCANSLWVSLTQAKSLQLLKQELQRQGAKKVLAK